MGRKKIAIGDIFYFNITEEILDILKVQPKNVFEKIKASYDRLEEKIGYGMVVNIKEEFKLIQLKRVDKENPTLEDIQNSKTISLAWTYERTFFRKEYKVLGNIRIEPIKVDKFWIVGGKHWKEFVEGKDVEIEIVQVEGYDVPKKIGVTHDVNIIKELFCYKGLDTYATIMMEYLLNYDRDENKIETLKV